MSDYLSLEDAAEVAEATAVVETMVPDYGPVAAWANRCHEVSLAVLKSGVFGPGRVARGTSPGVHGQHSWIVLGKDVYSRDAVVVDPTYNPTTGQGDSILVVRNRQMHSPHGWGDIWTMGGPPEDPTGPLIELAGYDELSVEATAFLAATGYPLDYQGWSHIAHGPMEGWASGEIISAMCETRELRALAPIDIVGHVTDRNPGGLYW